MSKWVQVVEEGQVFWVNEELGNVYKAEEGMYLSLLPRVLKMGPFKTLEEAQLALESKAVKAIVDQHLDVLNAQVVDQIKGNQK